MADQIQQGRCKASSSTPCSPSWQDRFNAADRCLCQLQGMLDVVDPDDALGDHIIERLWNYMARHDQALIKERLCSIDEMIAWADFDQDPENDQGETRQPQSDTPETTEPHEK